MRIFVESWVRPISTNHSLVVIVVELLGATVAVSALCVSKISIHQLRKRRGLRIVLISILASNIMLIIHVLNILLSMMLRFLAVNPIHSLCLCQFIDLCTCDTNKELLGKLVRNGLSCDKLSIRFLFYARVWGRDGGEGSGVPSLR